MEGRPQTSNTPTRAHQIEIPNGDLSINLAAHVNLQPTLIAAHTYTYILKSKLNWQANCNFKLAL